MQLSQKLISLRKGKGLTQQQLAEKINYSDKVISKWERGDSVPDINALGSIAKFYDITLDDLMKSCEIVKSDESPSQLKKAGLLFHILLAILPLMVSIIYICMFNNSYGGAFYVHDEFSIISIILLLGVSIFTVIDLILCHLKINRLWASYAIFGIICSAILLLIISCILYGSFASFLDNFFVKIVVCCFANSVISVGFGYVFYRNKQRK